MLEISQLSAGGGCVTLSSFLTRRVRASQRGQFDRRAFRRSNLVPKPPFPIIDAHVHLYDSDKVPYTWMKEEWPTLDFPHLMPELDRARGTIAVEKVIFCEVRADRGRHLEEAAYVQGLASHDPRISAITAWAPIEKGAAVEDDLLALKQNSLVRGVRRGFDAGNYGMGLEPLFLEGIRTLGRMGLHYELGLPHWLLGYGLEVARRVPEVPIILNHIGNPDIRHGLWEPWRTQIVEFAKLENVSVKISGAMAGADKNWKSEDVVPFVRHAIESFGYGRSMYGSDWPAAERFNNYGEWVEIVDSASAGASAEEKNKLYRDTAARVFRLEP
jgi:L-fuconolactonase